MSKVVFFSYPLFGHVNYGLKLAKKLQELGEDVYYYSGHHFQEMIESKGVHFCPFKTVDQLIARSSGQVIIDSLEAVWAMGHHFLEIYQNLLENDLKEIQHIAPDYIIYDALAIYGMQMARFLNVPAIASVTGYAFNDQMLEYDPDCFIRNALQKSDSPLFAQNKFRTLKRTFDLFSERLNKMFKTTDYHITDSFYGHEELNIMYTCREFQLHAHLFDERCVFTGPAIHEDDLNVDTSQLITSGKKVIYISMGTIHTHQVGFYRQCIEIFKNSDYQILMSVGSTTSLDELGEIPENFIVKNNLPQIALLKDVAVFISHGGANSAREAMYFGVPMIIFPQANDHFVVAEDVERLQLGIYIRDMDTALLRDAVDEIMANEQYRTNCQQLSTKMRACGGLDRAAEAIFAFKISKGIQ